ncbi:MAG: hypothetical protein ACI35O_03995 [Bacillaceae bacterium]
MECSNCGDQFNQGEGFPENHLECCCSMECWFEFIGENENKREEDEKWQID